MIKRSTLSELISYAYNETGLCDSDRIQRSIDGDPLLQEEYKELTTVIQTLDAAKPVVSEESINRILQFAR